MKTSSDFSKWRSYLWPIHKSEISRFLPLFFIFILIAFVYNILRSYKDTLVVTSASCGAEVLAFAKTWTVLPCAILMTILFTRLSSHFNKEKVFYIMIFLFLAFFVVFAFVLYPARDILHPHGFADYLQTILPKGLSGLIALIRNWTFTLFYVMSELWSSMIFTVLFWSFVNDSTTISDARRFYPVFCTGGNIAGILSGEATLLFSNNSYISWIPYGKTAWDQSIFWLTVTLIISGLLIMILFRHATKHMPKLAPVAPQDRPKYTFRQSLSYLLKSKYLICIALIVLGYNIVINLLEVVWKNQVKLLYPQAWEYNAYMGKVLILMGIFATLAGLFISTNLIRRYSWTFCALITPLVVGITGILFFSLTLLHQWGIPIYFLAASPVVLSVTFGAIQNSLSRASKYTVFDSTKEMAFIPLDSQTKLKGKAAIDGVGSRLGKSGGSVIHQGLLLTFSSLSAATPYIAAIFIGIVILWSMAVVSLGKQFDEKTAPVKAA